MFYCAMKRKLPFTKVQRLWLVLVHLGKVFGVVNVVNGTMGNGTMGNDSS